MSCENISLQDVEFIKQQAQKIQVLNSSKVNVQTLTQEDFEKMCKKFEEKQSGTLVQAIYLPKSKKIITMKN